MKHKSQENAVFIAIHPPTYRSGGFLAHGVLKYSIFLSLSFSFPNNSTVSSCPQLIIISYFITRFSFCLNHKKC